MKFKSLPALCLALLFVMGGWTVVGQERSAPQASGTHGTKTDLRTIRTFALKNAVAEWLAGLLKELFGRDNAAIAVDQRTNSIVVRATEADHAIIKMLITRLDLPRNAKAGKEPRADRKGMREKEEGENQPNPEQQRRLRRQVEMAFDARQASQRAKIKRMRDQLSRIEQSVVAREQLKEKIIERRVEELLNPNLQWSEIYKADSDSLPPAEPSRTKIEKHSAHVGHPNVLPRSASELRTKIAELTEHVASYEAVIKHNPQHDDIGGIQKRLQTVRRDLEIYRAELAAQIRLLEIEVEAAKNAIGSAETKLAQMQNLEKRGFATRDETDRVRRSVQAAQHDLDRAQTMLDLFQKADADRPRPSASEAETPKQHGTAN